MEHQKHQTIAARAAFALSVAALLFGCASQADQEVRRIQSLARDGLIQEQACYERITAKPQYAHLYVKFGRGFENGKLRIPTPEQLADTESISDDDIAHGLDRFAELQGCDLASMDTLGKIDPELMVIAARFEDEGTSLVREIVRDRPTYGAVNTKIMEMRTREIQAVTQWAQNLRARLDEMRRQEKIEHEQFVAQIGTVTEALATIALTTVGILAQQQSLAAQAQLSYARAHPAYVPAFRITTTNCQWIGSIWSCTSY